MSAAVDIKACPNFAPRLLAWFDEHGRHDLPWQHPRTLYRVWVSEIMLQQTQVATVMRYFDRFITRFPDVQTLGEASLNDVLEYWQGLGYYRRARFLHQAAQQCLAEHGTDLPDTLNAWLALPGIGRSTGGAVLSQALNQPHAILDGNVKRVLCRLHGVDEPPNQSRVEKKLWQLSETLLLDVTSGRAADYTQALMDFGATWCRKSKPQCDACPFQKDCIAHQQQRVDELPIKPQKKAVPERHFTVLMLHHPTHGWLLEQRSSEGIWPSLFSFPMQDRNQPLQPWLEAQAITTPPQQAQSKPVVKHRLTHMHMHLHPLVLSVTHHHLTNTQRWATAEASIQLGMPKPMRYLIEHHSSKEPT